MAFVFSDIEFVALLATILVVVYFLGTYWKHRVLTKYAHWFEERFSRHAKVRYKSFGHAGLRIKCQMNSLSDEFKELEFALALGARENLIYYPYSFIVRESDRLNCWGLLTKPVEFQVKIAKGKKKVPLTWETAGLEKIEMPEVQKLGYVVYSTGREYANRFVQRSGLASRLKDLDGVESLELERETSRLHLAARLREENLPGLMDFIALLGRSV